MPQHPKPPPQIGVWWLNECLGSGFSGAIYKATNIHTNLVIALKIQHVDHEYPTNRREREAYKAVQGIDGFPKLWAAGVYGVWDFLCIDLLGPSLDSLFRRSGKLNMEMHTVLCVAIQLISRLEWMHQQGVLHRDIQLGNVVQGLRPNHEKLYLIDYGFAKWYIDPKTKRHISDSRHKQEFVGNYWFSSVRVHCRGRVPSRRDDMEAVALMLIHMLTPRGLPWTRNGTPKDDTAHNRLISEKLHAQPEDLCRGLPSEFEEFLRYCRRLEFQERPNYGRWIDEFKELLVDYGYSNYSGLIWPPPPPVEIKRNIPPPTPKRPTPDSGGLEEAMRGLANLNIQEKLVIGDAKKVEAAVRVAKETAKKPGSTDSSLPKAARIAQLTNAVRDSTDNVWLAGAVTEFIAALNSNSAKSITKDAQTFLRGLYIALSGTLTPALPSQASKNSGAGGSGLGESRLYALRKLRIKVRAAPSRKELGEMVAEFIAATTKAGSRTVPKDGFGFLEGLAARLEALG